MEILNSFPDAVTSVHILNEFSNVCIKKASATPQEVSKKVYELVEYIKCANGPVYSTRCVGDKKNI